MRAFYSIQVVMKTTLIGQLASYEPIGMVVPKGKFKMAAGELFRKVSSKKSWLLVYNTTIRSLFLA